MNYDELMESFARSEEIPKVNIDENPLLKVIDGDRSPSKFLVVLKDLRKQLDVLIEKIEEKTNAHKKDSISDPRAGGVEGDSGKES